MENVHFEFRRADIQPACGSKIAKLAAWLKQDLQIGIALDGHVDDARANDDVPDLGMRRAQAVRDALIAEGVAAERITIGGFGSPKPPCGDATEECLVLVRRVEILAARRL